MILLDLIYLLAALAALPFLIRKSRRTGKYRTGLAERFGFGNEPLPNHSHNPHIKILLLHTVSVGELNSVQTLIQKLLAADPDLHIALTTTTDTGTERAQKLYGASEVVSGQLSVARKTSESFPLTTDNWLLTAKQTTDHRPLTTQRVHPLRFPFDFSFAVERLFDRVRPDAIALVELETWPNFLAIAQSRRIPVALINGRMTERSFPRYRLICPLMQAMLRQLTWIGAQTPAIAQRFLALGAPPEKLEVLPTLKYDNAPIVPSSLIAPGLPGINASQSQSTSPQTPEQLLAQAIGLLPSHQLFVAGSIAPGEELPLLQTYLTLRTTHPNLRLALVPRHPESLPQMITAIESHHLTPIFRTNRPDPTLLSPQSSVLSTNEIFLLNTMGELRKLYVLAFAVFLGRSLVKLGGSDMIEAAALAKPTCFGPYTHNFTEVVELLAQPQKPGAIIIYNAQDLTRTLQHWLENPAAARAMGQTAQSLIASQKGSTDRYVSRLLTLLHPSLKPSPAPATQSLPIPIPPNRRSKRMQPYP